MSYVQSVLQPGERLIVEGRPHWITYGRAIVCFALAVVALVARPQQGQDLRMILQFAALALTFVGLGFAAHAWFLRWTTEIGVTDRRVIYKNGFVSRHTAEMNMDKIETVSVEQSLLGRVLDYGTITIEGTGAGIESLARIASPIALRNAITAR